MEKQTIKTIKKFINDPKIKVFIFDFDGIFTHLNVDYDSLKKHLSEYFLSRYNFKNNFDPLGPNLELLKNELGLNALKQAYKIIEKYEIKGLRESKVNKEIADLMKLIKHTKSDKKIAIFSMNMHKTIKNFLIKNKLIRYIDLIIGKDDVIIGKDDVDKYKPHPYGLNKILLKLRIDKKQALFIGDKEIDLKSGLRSGIKTIII
jgi:phosphoglycolate phosphatase-like HAD superfamily hydrolase